MSRNQKILSLKDFDLLLKADIITKSGMFQSFIDQMDAYQHNGYFIESQTNTGHKMKIKHPYLSQFINVVSFVSNDYLGLSRHPEVVAASIDALKIYGTGACAAPIIGGYMSIHKELEVSLAEFVGQEDTMISSSGFGTNEGVLKALLGKNDIALTDSYIHASSLNGLSNTNVKHIGHNDIPYLEKILHEVKDKFITKLVIIDGVYSQDGDISLLPEILQLCEKYGAFLMLDDAHGIGTFGPNGRGVAEYYGLLGKVDIITGTLSKSFGCVGGFVAASKKLIQYLRYYTPQTVFSAAPVPSVAASALKALEIIKREPQIRERLWENTNYFKEELRKANIETGSTVSPIVPIKIRDNKMVKDISASLLNKGYYAIGICYPAVREKEARIRCSILADHSKSDIFAFVNALRESCIEYNPQYGKREKDQTK